MIKRNKNFEKLILSLGMLVCFSSCELLQNSLSSVQEEKLAAETGVASLNGKVWYYNGIAGEDISDYVKPGSLKNSAQSLRINFSKAVALDNLSGSMKLSYRASDGFMIEKLLTDLSGSFAEDAKSFNLDMDEIVKLLDGETIADGTANVALKLSGFICAEGEQAGRPLPAIEENISIKPFFNTKTVNFSTCWYEHGKSVINFPVNGDFTLVGSESIYTVGDGTNTFKISADGSNLMFTPKNDIKNVITEYDFPVYGILPATSGDEFVQTIKVKLVEDAIIIDGLQDSNYTVDRASVFEDEENDQNCFDHTEQSWTSQMGDIKKMYVVNDNKNLYIGLSGEFNVNWNDSITLMICKAGSSNDATATAYQPAETTSYWKGRPDVYIYHKPGFENSGNGLFGVLTGSSKTNITENCDVSPKGWTTETNGSFVEYSIPLSKVGYAKGDSLQIIAALSLNWDEGCGVCDVLPSAAVRSEKDGRTKVQFTFENAAEFKIQ